MTSILQRDLPGLDAIFDAAKPLVELTTVADLLGYGPDAALALVEEREIKWAFNLATRQADRRMIRVWRDEAMSFLRTRRKDVEKQDMVLGEVIAAILPSRCGRPADRMTIRGVDLQKRFSCSQWHIKALMVENQLLTRFAPGMKATPEITYQSAFEFLQRRAM